MSVPNNIGDTVPEGNIPVPKNPNTGTTLLDTIPPDLQNPNYGTKRDDSRLNELARQYGYSTTDAYFADFDKFLQAVTGKQINQNQFYNALDNELVAQHYLEPGWQEVILALARTENQKWRYLISANRPRAMEEILFYENIDKQTKAKAPDGNPGSTDSAIWNEYMKAFTKDPTKGPFFEAAFDFLNTSKRVSGYIDAALTRANNEPDPVYPWEFRLGAARFLVPPININVSQTNRVGSMTGGALRQQTTPKFNSGYSETIINLTLYFPNWESIWGVDDISAQQINFMPDGDSDQTIDKFLSSLRGLITAFRYAPFLPVKNSYLNQAWGITAVALSDISVSTIENFPFCVVVNLTLLKFNHKVYLPVVEDFNEAIHWGRFRQYMGRAAKKIVATANQGFVVQDGGGPAPTDSLDPSIDPNGISSNTSSGYGDTGSPPVPTNLRYENDPDPNPSFDVKREWNDGKNLDIYYPVRTPAQVFAPDNALFRAPQEDNATDNPKDSWDAFMGHLGIDVNDTIDAQYDNVRSYSTRNIAVIPEGLLLLAYLQQIPAQVDAMDNDKLNSFLDHVVNKYIQDHGSISDAQRIELVQSSRNVWFSWIFTGYRNTPFFKNYLMNKQFVGGKIVIDEWMIPMQKMPFNWNHIFIQGISVSLGNNLARLQVQLQDEPVHQHIGGKDSRVAVSMVIFGEEELIKFRKVFDHIKGLARLEHAHGVLGFLGIKNVLTALCGIKYVLPLSYEVDTIPGYPHVYTVRLNFVDFDVFQQQRENLSIDQQQELVTAFGKRNPFLRIKQLWGAFNAYPDFPLSIRNSDLPGMLQYAPVRYEGANRIVDSPDPNAIVGHLEPDFYFRAFQTIDDEVAYMGHGQLFGEFANLKTTKEALDTIKNLETWKAAVLARPFHGQQGDPDTRKDESRSIDDKINYLNSRISNQANPDAILNPVIPGAGTGQSYTDEVYGPYSQQHSVDFMTATYGDNQDKIARISIGKNANLTLGHANVDGTETYDHTMEIREESHQDTLTSAILPGNVPAGGPNGYQNPTINFSTNLTRQFQTMMLDTQYRDISGRMVRAFPTYMLWLIDEGGRYAGVKLFDNFYGLQSVIDFSILQSEDILGDTLVLRVSNLYQKLTTPYKAYLARQDGDQVVTTSDLNRLGQLLDRPFDVQRNLESGTNPQYIVDIENIQLKPGVRVHMRMGYSANPNALQTVFNGTITTVESGDIMTITAQSDAIELAPYVNSTNKKGDSGKIDGALNTGLWMSEPRDLMVRLLSMGASTFKEGLAAATDGMIFSENRFGIRHFGNILYEPLNQSEKDKQDVRYNTINQAMKQIYDMDQSPGDIASSAIGDINPISALTDIGFQAFGGDPATRSPVIAATQAMWVNFFRKRDYELFKRNIYPGNGTGIAQYLGGDAGDGGLQVAMTAKAKGVVPGQWQFPTDSQIKQVNDPTIDAALNDHFSVPTVPGNVTSIPTDPTSQPNSGANAPGSAPDGGGSSVIKDLIGIGEDLVSVVVPGFDIAKSALDLTGSILTGKNDSPILQALGISGRDDDVAGFDEVSFRAQTYMKSVWDLFQLCAALQPNYIVAVRPFEDRSTVFYGKPHWLWTSAVIPITTGVPQGGAQIEGRDKDLQDIIRKIETEANPLSDYESQLKILKHNEPQTTPYSSPEGIPWTGGDIAGNQSMGSMQRKGATINLPSRSGKVGLEMHLPTDPPDTDISNPSQHKQLPDLPADQRHPGYMDPAGGAHGGDSGFQAELAEQQKNPRQGQPGAFGYLDPLEEQWYICMRWDYTEAGNGTTPGDYKYARVVVKNKANGMACVCSVCEYGPYGATGRVAGLSPDVMWVTKGQTDSEYEFGFVPDNTKLGPISDLGTTNNREPGAAAGKYVTINEDIWNQLSDEGKASIGGAYKDQGAATAPLVDDITGNSSGGYVDYEITDESKVNSLRIDYKKLDWWPKDRAPTTGGISLPGVDRDLSAAEMAYYYGAGKGHNLIPVFLDPYVFSTSATAGDADLTGIAARRIYDATFVKRTPVGQDALIYTTPQGDTPNISVDTAQDIWNELRERALDVFLASYVKVKFRDPVYAWVTKAFSDRMGNIWSAGQQSFWDDVIAGKGGSPVPSAQTDYINAVDLFLRFLWQSPFGRAYVVITAPHFDHGMLSHGIGPALTHGPDWDFENSDLMKVFTHWVGAPGDPFNGMGQPMDIDKDGARGTPGAAGGTAGESPSHGQLVDWMQHNITLEGKTGTASEHFTEIVDNTIGKWVKYITMALTGVTGAFRLSMQQLGEGLGMVSTMQKQANIMNKVLNDSIYYSAGPVGSLMFLVDNCFTREYGEPVVEVREPFQRCHYISSFQHILNNGIQQTINNVPTVVTATSDGEYPVTVYFDKGLSSQKQVEATIETGLYWDNARGTGFFGFLHPLLHPIETMRSIIKEATGSSDELLSKRVALWHLKEGLKDIYQGEIIILGNPDIRPHDLIYIADVYERMYGMCEVEQIVHHFTPETGFISSITPNALVTINDPARWSLTSWMWSWWAVKATRDHARTLYFGAQGTDAPIDKGDVGVSDIEESLSPSLLGSTQYTHGNSALVRDIASYRGVGLLGQPLTLEQIEGMKSTGVDIGSILQNAGSTLLGITIPGFYAVQDFWSDTWDWFRENLVDQHNCYVQYLVKDGIPMDAGLSYNMGVAVGTHYSVNILPGILGIPMNIKVDGHTRITTDDLMKSLGWSEMDVSTISKDVSWWVNQTNADILKLSGTGPDSDTQLGFGQVPVEIITIDGDRYNDGDSIYDTTGKEYRLNGINTPETIHSGGTDINNPDFASVQAANYLKKRLYTDPIAEGYAPTVAIRNQGPDNAPGSHRTLATIFHNVPYGTKAEDRDAVLRNIASKTPLVPWDSYMDDGRPYTINWEMVMKGYTQTILYSVNRNNPDIGAIGLGK